MRLTTCSVAYLCLLLAGSSGHAQDKSVELQNDGRIVGFTEPYKQIRVASPETGILERLHVNEGDVVEQGAPLATLDTDVHQALLDIAQAGRDARGRLDSAQAEVVMRADRLEKLKILLQRGHARQEEVARAATDLSIAQGNLLSVQEQQELKKMEYDKLVVQLERRTISAPLAGVITRILKQPGEFVAPNDPQVVQLVQLNPLTAVFMAERQAITRLSVGQKVDVEFVDAGRVVPGEIEFVSPTIDAESGTVKVKVMIANPTGELQSGERCALQTAD